MKDNFTSKGLAELAVEMAEYVPADVEEVERDKILS